MKKATVYVSLICLALCLNLRAADFLWKHNAEGSWTNAANWIPPGVPSGEDLVTISNGVVDLPETVLTLANTKLYGGTLRGSFDVDGVFEWRGGTVNGGTTTVLTNGLLHIAGDAIKTLQGHTLTNQGWIAWTNSGRLAPWGTVVIQNQPGGVFEAQGDGSLDKGSYSGNCVFQNDGVFRKTCGTNATRFLGVAFNSAGAVEVQAGALQLEAGGELSGSLIASNDCRINLREGTFSFAGDVTAVNVKLNGGTISGTSTMHGQMEWENGKFSGGHTTIATNCTLRIVGDVTKDLQSHTLVNEGWIEWTNSACIAPQYTVVLHNQPGAVFEAQGDGSLDKGSYAGTCVFQNDGVFRKTGGTNATSFREVTFNTTGTVEVHSGSLQLEFGGECSGSLVADDGCQIRLTDGTFQFAGEVAVENLILAGGAISGTNMLHGYIEWESGNFTDGASTLATNCTLRISGAATRSLVRSVLTNEGWIVWTDSGRIAPGNGTRLVNQPGAVFEAQGDGTVDMSSGSSVFVNAGVFRKSGGTNATRFVDVPFNTTGAVEVHSGALQLEFGGELSGSLVADDGCQIRLTEGTFQIEGEVAVVNLRLVGGTLSGTNTLHGSIEWKSGNFIGGATTLATNCTLRVTGPATRFLSNYALTNGGWILWTDSGRMAPGSETLVINQQEALFEIQGDGAFDTSSGAAAFNNLGRIRKTGGTGTNVFDSVAFSNAGTLEIATGTMSFYSGFTQTAGSTLLAGGALIAVTPLDVRGGTLSGTGPVYGNVTSAGSVHPGSSFGVLTIHGNYTQTGSLDLELGGLIPSAEFDQLVVAGVANLGGILNVSAVNGYQPNQADCFEVLSFGSRTGGFAEINGLDLGSGTVLQTNWTATALRFVTETVPVEGPTLGIASLAGGQIRIELTVTTPGVWELWGSTNLSEWFVLQSTNVASGELLFSDALASNRACCFYQVRRGPWTPAP